MSQVDTARRCETCAHVDHAARDPITATLHIDCTSIRARSTSTCSLPVPPPRKHTRGPGAESGPALGEAHTETGGAAPALYAAGCRCRPSANSQRLLQQVTERVARPAQRAEPSRPPRVWVDARVWNNTAHWMIRTGADYRDYSGGLTCRRGLSTRRRAASLHVPGGSWVVAVTTPPSPGPRLRRLAGCAESPKAAINCIASHNQRSRDQSNLHHLRALVDVTRTDPGPFRPTRPSNAQRLPPREAAARPGITGSVMAAQQIDPPSPVGSTRAGSPPTVGGG